MNIKNLSQLKKAFQNGCIFKIVSHNRSECVGEVRTVTKTQTNGFYSKVNEPEHKTYTANNGLGFWCEFGKASNWTFDGNLCTYSIEYKDNKHYAKQDIMTIEVV